jgi:threonine/homoserine/homoserine lactone efflux protein
MFGHASLFSAPQLLPFLLAALGGLVFAAAPGPLNVATVQRTVERGFLAGACVQVGALVGEGSYALVAAAGVGIVAMSASIQAALGIAATALLGFMGWSALQSGISSLRRPGQGDGRAVTDTGSRLDNVDTSAAGCARRGGWGQYLRTGAVVSFLNPYIFGFWISAGTSTLRQYRGNEALYLSGFFLSVLVWAVALPALVSIFRPVGNVGNGRILSCISMVSGLLLLGFGLKLGISLLPAVPDLGAAIRNLAAVVLV